MGQNLALNMESKGFEVSVYNRSKSKTIQFLKDRAHHKNITPTYGLEEFVNSLQKPRKILLMIKAGPPVDLVIKKLVPLLEKGDIVIDGGNSHFKDTERRHQKVEKKGLFYLGTGISGGEYGALHGPSIMAGGHSKAYREVEGILTKVAATTADGPCCAYLGPRSAGHYVKMIHNGIEYGVMQIVAESYDLMRKGLGMKPEAMGDIFKKWNQTLSAYLVEITVDILHHRDQETKGPLIDMILDRAKQKGTGKWSVQEALELGIPIPTIGAAVNARFISAHQSMREETGEVFHGPRRKKDHGFLKRLRDGFYLSIVMAYAQGMALLVGASSEYDYGLQLDEVARIWKDGCIIRADLLDFIREAFSENPALLNLMVSDQFRDDFKERVEGLRETVCTASELGVPVPAMSSSLYYFDSFKSGELPANLIQAQRDYFGAHGYERRDRSGTFHTKW